MSFVWMSKTFDVKYMMIFHAFNYAYDLGIGRKASICTFKQYKRKWSKIVALYSWSRESPNVRSRSFLNSASRRTKGPAFTSCPSSAGCNVTALDSIQNWSFSFHILFYVKIKFQLFTWCCSRCIKVHSSIEPAL